MSESRQHQDFYNIIIEFIDKPVLCARSYTPAAAKQSEASPGCGF